jgi:DNA polymerase-3 subunit delta'
MWDVVGQTKAVSLLRSSLEKGKLAHAYLFVGPAGIGKNTLALNLAQALNCEQENPPCGSCTSCKKILEGKHADVQTIVVGGPSTAGDNRNKTEIGIEQIRDVLHSANLPPFEGNHRVYIVEGAELMSTDAANCLLKTLEEPAEHVMFILLTSSEKQLLETIKSRCQRIELPPLPADEVEKALTGRSVDPQNVRLLSKLAHGCPGWAFNALKNNVILEQRKERLQRFVEAMKSGYVTRFALSAEVALQFSRSRSDVFDVLKLWLDVWHDVLLVKTGVPGAVASVDIPDALMDLSQAFSLAQIKEAIHAIESAIEQLRLNANPQLVLEVLMLNIEVIHG